MPENAIRFAVRNKNNQRSVSWKLWTNTGTGRDDLYLVCRPLGGKLKTSFHQSGQWQISFIPSFLKANVPAANSLHANRHIERWNRPREIAPHITLAYRILVPAVAVNVPVKESWAKKIEWIESAPTDKATEIDVVITSPEAVVSSWPGQRSMGTNLVKKLQMDCGDSVWVVAHTVEMPRFPPRNAKPVFFDSSKGDLQSHENLRAILVGNCQDGSRYLVDCPVSVA